MFPDVVALAVLVIWLYLLFGRGAFWLARTRDDAVSPPPPRWPRVTAVIPARNEADCIEQSVGSLATQDYPGELAIVVVDDDSDDGTAAVARQAAGAHSGRRVMPIVSRGVAAGWTGKLWALHQGIEAATAGMQPPEYLLLTDADIVHSPDSLRALVARAENGGLVLTSLMARLRCESFAERSHVPAFVFFFQMLFPFSWVNSLHRPTAAAAGGCMLVGTGALQQIGGIQSIRSALIDDCALAQQLKSVGPIWLGLTDRVRSIRRYDGFAEVRRMISRSAYSQLNCSPFLLVATSLGMALAFLAGPLLAIFGDGAARLAGALTWALMTLAFQPMLRFYRVSPLISPLWGLALPAIAAAYMLYTLESAYRHVRGEGGRWKGRIQANTSCP
jgi:hopene-associated glycosyltransferase HpnB